MLLNSGQAQFKQKVARLLIARRQMPILLVFLGLGIIAVVAGNTLAGSVRPGSLGTKHIGWMLVGLAAFSAGIALDLTRGERYVARWLKNITNITNGRRRAGKFLAVSLELAFLTLVIREFRLGNQSFYEQIAVLVLAGFVIHYFLPSRYRPSFFLLPNIAFPLFPVVDYRTFRGTYYDSEQFEIYQRGVEWMFRGITHLLLYRFIYYYLTISPAEVMNVGDLARYLVTTFALYLWVSGVFHLIVGMLHLFGFHLPETNHRYFLASSFTDFWRRINIYWKDFMLKVFYFPIYFKLRTWGTFQALVTSTLIVFFITWFLHSLQFFWVRGSFLFAWQDVCFWAVLGLLVVISAVDEARHGRE